ncbi:MAG: PIN domain-containing protein [Chloroflexi bacterium]|nr:PIN domain-containing protein [Chloroflexota bacterium]
MGDEVKVMAATVLDAGVLIAFMDRSDIHHLAARSAIPAPATQDAFVLPASASAEILVLPSRLGGEAVQRTDDLLDTLPARVEPISRRIAAAAAGLKARCGRALKPDALVIATAHAVVADRILTTDQRWPDVGVVVHRVAEAT